jgi:large subunit ribosomal protein L15
MISLSDLPKTTHKGKKRAGRGSASGQGGHMSAGRGMKGTKARYNVKLTFSGTKIKKSWLKRLPFWRGKGRQKGQPKPIAINVKQLEEHFNKGDKITKKSLNEKGLLRQKDWTRGAKILGQGELKKKLIVKVPVSKTAQEKIEAAGGKVTNK